jgi:hypothetical protein
LLVIMPALCRAEAGVGNTDAAENVGGTIPVIQKVFVSGEGYPNFFSGITVKDYRTGFKETNEGKVILTVLSNAQWKVSVRGEFKPVGKYIKPASDLLIKIKDKTVIDEGIGTGGNVNEVFLDFGPLSSEDQALWMNEEGGDHCQASIDYKVLLSSGKDIPGEYSIVVTYTISAP